MSLQAKCSKCNLPLEVLSRQLIGLGADCEQNAHLAYLKDVEDIKKQKLEMDANNQFSWLALMAEPINVLKNTMKASHASVQPELNFTFDRLAMALASHGTGEILPWSIVLDCFSIARNSSDFVRDAIHKALNSLGFSRFIALASGDFCIGEATLAYNAMTNRIELEANIRRSATEVFNVLKSQDQKSVVRLDRTRWRFALKHAQTVLNTVNLRFPLPGTLTIDPSFWIGLELSKNIPVEVEEPEVEEKYFLNEAAAYREISVRKGHLADGSWALPYENPIYQAIINVGGRYIKEKCSENWAVYLLPEQYVDEIQELVKEVVEKHLEDKKNNPAKTVVNGAVKKPYKPYRGGYRKY